MFGAGSGPGGGNVCPFYIQFVLHDVWRGRVSGNDFLWPCPYYSCGKCQVLSNLTFSTPPAYCIPSRMSRTSTRQKPNVQNPWKQKGWGTYHFIHKVLNHCVKLWGPKFGCFEKLEESQNAGNALTSLQKWYCQRLLVFPKENLDRVLKIK